MTIIMDAGQLLLEIGIVDTWAIVDVVLATIVCVIGSLLTVAMVQRAVTRSKQIPERLSILESTVEEEWKEHDLAREREEMDVPEMHRDPSRSKKMDATTASNSRTTK